MAEKSGASLGKHGISIEKGVSSGASVMIGFLGMQKPGCFCVNISCNEGGTLQTLDRVCELLTGI